jgi:trans-2,3-dihydro-3-hydroxyanthranilate isomerase
VTVDVFTDRPFGGNPLAVILYARSLSDAQMQAIAREFNYSEQTFVLPPENPAHTARVRIFNPTAEMPFADHPNVGTAYVLARGGTVLGQPVGDALVFEKGAGPVRAEVLRDGGTVVGARIAAPLPLDLGPELPVAPLAACVGLPPDAFSGAVHPPRVASVGLTQGFAELPDLATLAAARPDASAFAAADAALPLGGAALLLHIWTRTGPGAVRARMFGPTIGVPEDPATGSAAGALGALLAARGEGVDVVIEQGYRDGVPQPHRGRRARGRGHHRRALCASYGRRPDALSRRPSWRLLRRDDREGGRWPSGHPSPSLASVRPDRQVSRPDTCPTPSVSAGLLPAVGTLGRTFGIPTTL